jgi:NTP pyrophosphatase (non-canonical NTP hydrolase)
VGRYTTAVRLKLSGSGAIPIDRPMTTKNKSKLSKQQRSAPGKSPDLAAVLAAPPESLKINQYQQISRLTDRIGRKGGLDFPLLGLFGEIGSLLSELKKKQRDTVSYYGYEESVVEELGDVLWYFSNLANRAGISISEMALQIRRNSAKARPPIYQAADISFAALQPSLRPARPGMQDAFEATLMRLAGEAGKLISDFSAGRISRKSDLLSSHMSSIFEALINAANEAHVSLADAAHRNLQKTFDRWPQKKTYPPLFDADENPEEQIPRRIEMEIFERTVNNQTYVFLRCNDINIGDRLTDNKLEKDDYRFHDVFHLANAAILGWSPVMRALFRVKRKSRPKLDEAEDGARAILIEEGISTWVFNHAGRLNNFENLDSLDYGLLKAVRALVSGYEAERCPLWLWEETILQGYKMFRQLRKHRGGTIVADLNKRTVTFERIKK